MDDSNLIFLTGTVVDRPGHLDISPGVNVVAFLLAIKSNVGMHVCMVVSVGQLSANVMQHVHHGTQVYVEGSLQPITHESLHGPCSVILASMVRRKDIVPPQSVRRRARALLGAQMALITCPGCLGEYGPEHFYKNHTAKTGRDGYCMKCRKEKNKESQDRRAAREVQQ